MFAHLLTCIGCMQFDTHCPGWEHPMVEQGSAEHQYLFLLVSFACTLCLKGTCNLANSRCESVPSSKDDNICCRESLLGHSLSQRAVNSFPGLLFVAERLNYFFCSERNFLCLASKCLPLTPLLSTGHGAVRTNFAPRTSP